MLTLIYRIFLFSFVYQIVNPVLFFSVDIYILASFLLTFIFRSINNQNYKTVESVLPYWATYFTELQSFCSYFTAE